MQGGERVLRSFIATSATVREADYDKATARRIVRVVIVIAIIAVLVTVTAVATVTIVTDQGEVVASVLRA